MNKPRVIGMTINHHEIEHTLQHMADVLRNAAYQVANEKYPVGNPKREEFFDETGTLIVMDETSVKALLKDALEHYLMFNATSRSTNSSDFNYYLSDSFAMVSDFISNDPQKLSYLSAQFARACGMLAGCLAPVIEDISNSGQLVEKVESFTLNTDESYYVVFGESVENMETYDPKDDDLSTVDVYQSPEELEGIAKRGYIRSVNGLLDENTILEKLHNGENIYLPGQQTTYTDHTSAMSGIHATTILNPLSPWQPQGFEMK